MPKWWWWWVPGLHKKWKLEKRRASALVFIEGERASVQQMSDRPHDQDDRIEGNLLTSVMSRIAEVEHHVRTTSDYDRIGELMDISERQAQLRAYLCPQHEIYVEASLSLGLLQEWSVPKSIIDGLGKLLNDPLNNAAQNPRDARSALRAIFEETDSWDDYTSDHADDMRKFTRLLFWPTIAMIACAVAILHYNWVTPVAMLLAGASGSCVSVMTKMPEGVSLSGQLDSFERRILSRVAVGIVGSLVSSGFLAWGFISISIHNQTFGDVINSCCQPNNSSCGALRTLILIAVPMLFGFSERALASVEESVFGKVKKSRAK